VQTSKQVMDQASGLYMAFLQEAFVFPCFHRKDKEESSFHSGQEVPLVKNSFKDKKPKAFQQSPLGAKFNREGIPKSSRRICLNYQSIKGEVQQEKFGKKGLREFP
ncbi:hypothetical protein J6590_065726, partial [Homalodisca vitripennis]